MTNQQHQRNECITYESTPDKKINHKTLHNTPHCFIMDTDSRTYLLDSGANQFFVNDANMLKQFTAT